MVNQCQRCSKHCDGIPNRQSVCCLCSRLSYGLNPPDKNCTKCSERVRLSIEALAEDEPLSNADLEASARRRGKQIKIIRNRLDDLEALSWPEVKRILFWILVFDLVQTLALIILFILWGSS